MNSFFLKTTTKNSVKLTLKVNNKEKEQSLCDTGLISLFGVEEVSYRGFQYSRNMGVGDNSKRRSLLFPFAKSTPKETKFEVVNRKKNTASNLASNNTTQSQQGRRSSPSPFDTVAAPKPQGTRTTTTSSTSSPRPVKASTTNGASSTTTTTRTSNTSRSNPPIASNRLDPRITNPLKATSSNNSGRSAISSSDLPASNLNINFNVPPVPDYNSDLHAPPVTIKGRSVSLTKKDAPPRRKPPAIGSLGVHDNNSKSASDLSIQSHSDVGSLQSSGLNSNVIRESDIENDDIVEAEQVSKGAINSTKPSVPNEEISAPETIPPVIAPPDIIVNDDANESEYGSDMGSLVRSTSNLNLAQEYHNKPTIEDALEQDNTEKELGSVQGLKLVDSPQPPFAPFSNPSRNLSQADSFASASDFRDTQDFEDVVAPELSESEVVEPQTSAKEVVDTTVNKNLKDLEDYEDPDSSFETKPLFFHKKSWSTPNAGIVRNDASIYTNDSIIKSPTKTHAKQLSLSDDILKDIEDFQSAIPSHVQDSGDEISPVSPLALQNKPKPTGSRTALHEELSDEDDEDEPVYQPEEETPRRLVVQNPDSSANEPLFHDSSDDDFEVLRYDAYEEEEKLGQSPVEEYNYDHVGGLNLESRASSVQPEIDYHSSSMTNGGRSHEKKLRLTDDEDESDANYEHEFNRFSTENKDLHSYDNEALTVPAVNIPNDDSSTNDRNSFQSQTHSRVKSTTSEEDGDRHTYEGLSVEAGSEQASSYNYYAEAAQTRRFHVVNTGDYSDDEKSSSRDQYSFDQDRPESFNQDFSIVHQQLTDDTGRTRDSDEEDLLSFTAKSPIQTDFNFEKSFPPVAEVSEMSLSLSPNDIPITTFQSPSSSIPISSYDRREDTVAPVQYVSTYNGATKRPPPLSDAPKTTRVARSLSTSTPMPVNYNALQESTKNDDTPVQSDSHEPEVSMYVEMLRMSSGTANSDVSATTWGLPIGIADIDHSKLTATASRTAYKRAQRSNKSDLKHGKIKPRLLASEVDDDESTEMVSALDGQSVDRNSLDLEKSRTPSFHSPTQSFSNFSPTRISPNPGISRSGTDVGVSRSGTLMGDKIGAQLGRSGSVMSTVKPVNNMTLFIANPDIEEDD